MKQKIFFDFSVRGAISGENTIEAYERLNRAQAQLQQLEDESNFWNEKLRLMEQNISNLLTDVALKEFEEEKNHLRICFVF